MKSIFFILLTSTVLAQGKIEITPIPKLTPSQAVAILVSSKSDRNMTGVYWVSKTVRMDGPSYTPTYTHTPKIPNIRLDGTPINSPLIDYGTRGTRITMRGWR